MSTDVSFENTLRRVATNLRLQRGYDEEQICKHFAGVTDKQGQPVPDEVLRQIARDAAAKPQLMRPAPSTNVVPITGPRKQKPRAAKAARRTWADVPSGDEEGLPTIVVTERHTDRLADEVIEAVVKWNDPPRLFRRAEGVALAYEDEEGKPALRSQTPARFLDTAARVARYVRYTQSGNGPFACGLPGEHAGVVLERLTTGQALPPLLGLADAPRMRPDGTILNESGYDPATGLYACFEPLNLDVPEQPTREELATARDLILELLVDFPFVRQADRANAIAALLTIPLRSMFDLAPLFALDATKAGTGKGLLGKTVTTVGRGAPPPPTPLPGSEEELRKLITSLLRAGTPVVCFDNISSAVRSDALCVVLTDTTWRERILGVSESPEIEHQTTWFMTGNNLRILGDLQRRTVQIRMDARVENPETRTGFRHVLPTWALENRARLLSAVFVLARSWIREGRPRPLLEAESLGSFEGWQRTIGGILEVAGIVGFLENREEQRATMDDEVAEWAEFLRVLGTVFPRPFLVKDAVKELRREAGQLRDALPDELDPNAHNFARTLGNAIKQRADRLYSLPGGATVEIKRAGSAMGGVARWQVILSAR
jgi:hypothetical protein